jgi:ribonuclease R
VRGNTLEGLSSRNDAARRGARTGFAFGEATALTPFLGFVVLAGFVFGAVMIFLTMRNAVEAIPFDFEGRAVIDGLEVAAAFLTFGFMAVFPFLETAVFVLVLRVDADVEFFFIAVDFFAGVSFFVLAIAASPMKLVSEAAYTIDREKAIARCAEDESLSTGREQLILGSMNLKRGRGGCQRGRHRSRRARPGRRERSEQKAPEQAAGARASRVVGELHLHRDGFGFVIPPEGGGDIFIPARYVGEALHTDLVETQVVSERRGKREGRIIAIVERRLKSLMGRLERHGAQFFAIADDRRVHHRIAVDRDKIGGASDGDNVILQILAYPKGHEPMRGEVSAVLGRRGLPSTEKEAVVARHQLTRDFPPRALREAEAVSGLAVVEEGRVDLTHLPFVTIDGEAAKDFDDAVAVERRPDGTIRLWVSIADVSHFVHPSSTLDAEAYRRGTSVYFPGDCLPMLPERLSNDLCSLKPDEDRLTMTAELDIDASGATVRRQFSPSIIRSRQRLTYTAVKQILVERSSEMFRRHRDLVPELELMEECFKRLRTRRGQRGSIDFDLPEPEIVIDLQGDISDIVRSERHVGHMIIEEFMIAANEAVAEYLTEHGPGCLYRVHEAPPPEKLHDFSILLHNLGYRLRLGEKVEPGALAHVVDLVRGKPEERLVNHSLLRSMSQAVYSVANVGHYGLASKCYCHFTSPIRRYPDLVIHRLLKSALSQKEEKRSRERGAKHSLRIAGLQEIAEHCSRRERIAMEAEREMAKLYAALFMQEHVGTEFDGIISHVAKFGFFVELIDFFVEGLVHQSALDDDRYIYEEQGERIRGKRTGKVFKIGDRVRVEVEEVDVPNREILFALV